MMNFLSNSVFPSLLTYGLVLFLSSWLAPDSHSPHVLLRATILQWLLLPGSIIFAGWIFRYDLIKTLKLSKPSLSNVAWSFLAALCLLPLLDEFTYLVCSFVGIPSSFQDQVLRFLRAETVFQLLLLWMALALTPAICEELFFRGFLLSRLTASLSFGISLALSSILFGIFHRSEIYFLPTTLAGFLLAIVAWKAQSVFPAMLIHCVVNSWGVLVANSSIRTLLPWTANPEPVPLWLLLTALAGLSFSIWGVEKRGNCPRPLAKEGTARE